MTQRIVIIISTITIALLSAVILLLFIAEPGLFTFNRLNNNSVFSAPKEPKPAKIVAFGDMMPGRYVETQMEKNGRNYPFAEIEKFIKQENADIVFANLEGPIVSNFIKTSSGVQFSFNPLVVLNIKSAGFNLLSLANNHLLDMGSAGFTQTKDFLKKASIRSFGHQNKTDKNSLFEASINGNKIIGLALNATYPPLDEKKALDLLANSGAEKNDFLFVSIHWGEEYKSINSSRQQALAHKLIDNGANLVIGHHSHVVQNIEKYKNGLIFYSLGNFIFDQYWSKETQKGLSFTAQLGQNETTYRLFPLNLEKSQPKLMAGEDKKNWLMELAKSNPQTELSSEIELGAIAVNRISLE